MWTEKNGQGHRAVWAVKGKPKKGHTFPTEAEATAWYEENGPKDALVTTVAAALDLWKAQKPSTHTEVAARRLSQVATDQKWVRLEQITPLALATWHKTTGGVGVKREQQYLLTLLRWLAHTYDIPVNAKVIGMKAPKHARRAKPPLLTDGQVEAIREKAMTYGPRAYALIDYLLTYGARPITACRLTIADLDPERETLRIEDAKHSGGWTHPLPEADIKLWLALHPANAKPSDPLFPFYRMKSKDDKEKDEPIRSWRMKDGRADELTFWYRATIAKKLKLPPELATIYHLKRYAITSMLRKGMQPADVALFTGHLTLEQVMTYNTTNEENARTSLEKLRPSNNPKELPRPPKEKS